jgi:hypothetical protein
MIIELLRTHGQSLQSKKVLGAGCVAQVVENLPSKGKALSLKPGAAEKIFTQG